MLTLFRYTISVILPIILPLLSIFGCSKKKKTALVSTASKESTISSATKSQEKIQKTTGTDSKMTVDKPVISKSKETGKPVGAAAVKPSEAVKPEEKKKEEGGKKKRSSGENGGKKKSAKSEQETQKLEVEKSKKAQKSCVNTAIATSAMMGTMREPSKIVKVGGATGTGADGGDGEGGYEKLGDLSADELKKIADAAPA